MRETELCNRILGTKVLRLKEHLDGINKAIVLGITNARFESTSYSPENLG